MRRLEGNASRQERSCHAMTERAERKELKELSEGTGWSPPPCRISPRLVQEFAAVGRKNFIVGPWETAIAFVPEYQTQWQGVPVRDCSPAPQVDRNEPSRMTHGCGQAICETSRPPPMLSPNLRWHTQQSASPCTSKQFCFIANKNHIPNFKNIAQ